MKRALLFLCLLFASASARAGGDVGGSSNSCHGQVAEDTARDLSEMKGYAEFQQKLALLREAAPTLGPWIDQRIHQLSWHETSCKLPDVSPEKTGVGHDWFQDCHQEENSDEIFCDGPFRATASEKTAGKELMHEVLMSLLEKKYSKAVRPVVEQLFKEPPKLSDIQGALARGGYGFYIDKPQTKVVGAIASWNYLGAIADAEKYAAYACDQDWSFQRVKEVLVHKNGKPPSKGNNDVWDRGSKPFISPFRDLATLPEALARTVDFVDTKDPLMMACSVTLSQFGGSYLGRSGFNPDACHEYEEGPAEYKTATGQAETRLRQRAFADAQDYAPLVRVVSEAPLEVLGRLLKNDAYLDMVPLLRSPKTELSPKTLATLDPGLASALRHAASLPPATGTDHEKRERLCKDIRQLVADLPKLRQDEVICKRVGWAGCPSGMSSPGLKVGDSPDDLAEDPAATSAK